MKVQYDYTIKTDQKDLYRVEDNTLYISPLADEYLALNQYSKDNNIDADDFNQLEGGLEKLISHVSVRIKEREI